MNKIIANQIIQDIEGTSPSYIMQYGLSTVKSAINYIYRLNNNKKIPDNSINEQIYRIKDKIRRITNNSAR